jgi:hypothetical protein
MSAKPLKKEYNRNYWKRVRSANGTRPQKLDPKRKEQVHAYYLRHKKEHYQKSREWLAKNKSRIKAWRKKYNVERRRAKELVKKFGITLEFYNKLLKRQRNVCAICRKPNKRRALAVDHRHGGAVNSKDVRGLLCDRCNLAIGLFSDNIDLLRKAIAYLEK